MITFLHQPAIPGTIIDGSTGTIQCNDRVVGDFIKLSPTHIHVELEDRRDFTASSMAQARRKVAFHFRREGTHAN